MICETDLIFIVFFSFKNFEQLGLFSNLPVLFNDSFLDKIVLEAEKNVFT